MNRLKTLATTMLLAATMPAMAQVQLGFDMGSRGQDVTEDHYGIFYEEINHAGDGGLYAELIRNRSFEDNAGNPDTWWTVGDASFGITTDNMLNTVQQHAMRVQINAAGAGVRNEGFWGINIVNGRQYTLSFWMRADERYEGVITAELQNRDGAGMGRVEIPVSATTEWKKYTATLTATGNDAGGWLALLGSEPGTVVFDVVSLFPPTFKNRPNGCRPDLAQKLADLKPRFMRFPGGCFIEGAHWGGQTNRFEWKKSIGPIEERPGHLNRNWGYRVTDGLGYHECLQLAEDIGAASMFVVNMGIGHDWRVDENDIEPYVQEALDAIEYALGSTDTYYGNLRAQNGHPEPFNLKYLEIGNEQEFMLNREAYLRRYMQFYTAIKQKWPQLHLIADNYYFDSVTEPVELRDEHFYESPQFFIDNYHRYDNLANSTTHSYVGEYAVTKDCGWWGNQNAAIGEAVFMQGCENNSSTVTMMSYAPIFTHEENYAWHPDMIRFNSSISYGTPSYYVQRMFANNIGKQNIRWTEAENTPDLDLNKGTWGLGTWATNATFTDLSVKVGDVTYNGSDTEATEWTTKNGTWSISDGTFNQTNATATNVTCILDQLIENNNVDLTVKATKNSGSEGFLIIFDYKDEQNYAWLNLGGWGNTKHAIEQCKNGTKSIIADATGKLTTGQEYTIRVVKDGLHVVCYLDGTQIFDTNLKNYYTQKVYVSANIDDDAEMLYVKLVNPNSTASETKLSFTNGRVVSAEAEVLSSPLGTDENTITNQYYIVPRSQAVSVESDGTINFNAAAFSVNVLRLKVADINAPVADPLPEARLSYSFSEGTPVDDSGNYEGTLKGQASIVQLADGNYVLATGMKGEQSYMDIPVEAVKQALDDATDYTISLDILQRAANNTSNYCWAFEFAQGTAQYAGLICAGGNGNWYYQVKNSSSTNTVDSWAGLRLSEWHNLTYTQKDGVGRMYIDGQLRNTVNTTVQPSSFVNSITSASIGHSPFAADAIMENALFDNLRIFDSALDETQVRDMARRTADMPTDQAFVNLFNNLELTNLLKEVKNYIDYVDYQPLTRAYNLGNSALSANDNIKRTRYGQLVEAVEGYKQQQLEKAAAGEAVDLSFLIENSSFTRYNIGWNGLQIPTSGSYTGYTNETAEQFSTCFDIWQEIKDLPEGYYTLTCSAFYRTGAIAAAYEAYQNDAPETRLAELYMNDQSTPVANLYSSDSYTYDPYTYPDNLTDASTALNTRKLYGENSVSLHIDEGQSLRIGLRKLQPVNADWVAYDNFRLQFEGNATGITQHQMSTSPILRTEYYSIDGRRTTASQRGIVILKQFRADGSVTTQKRLQ